MHEKTAYSAKGEALQLGYTRCVSKWVTRYWYANARAAD